MKSQRRLVESGSPTPSGIERRSAARHAASQEIPLRPVQSQTGVRWASILNLSRTGVGLILSCPFQRGTQLAMGFRPRPPQPARTVIGRVVHVRPRSSGNAYL